MHPFLKLFVLQEAKTYAKENGLFFMENSAKTPQNVNELLYEIGNDYNVKVSEFTSTLIFS